MKSKDDLARSWIRKAESDLANLKLCMENDESTPPLLGYLVLETLDLVVDPKAGQVIPNPAHDGKWITDLY